MIKIIAVFVVCIVGVELQPVSPKSGKHRKGGKGFGFSVIYNKSVHILYLGVMIFLDCQDLSSNCRDQLKHKNYCKHGDEWIRKFFMETCQKSCGLCKSLQ